jgi:hypothetical protein
MAAPRKQFTVNYFPVDNGGYEMWSAYQGSLYQADMMTAKSLGFNALRVFLAAKNGYFDFSLPTATQLANLTDFYRRAKVVGISLHLSLFDHWGSFGLISGSQAWLSALLAALPDTTNVAAIEIQNETRYASTAAYGGNFDSGWPSGLSKPEQLGAVAIVWSQLLIRYIRSIVPDVPVTVSCSHGEDDLSAFIAAVNEGPDAPDWYDWHCYTASRSLVHSALQAAVRIVGDPAMLCVGETGLTSTPIGTQGAVQGEQAQSDYIQSVRWSCAQLGLPEPSPWILFDIHRSAQFPDGQAFGLLDAAGNAKLSGQMYQRIPPGSTVPAIGLNGRMEGNQPDAYGNALPARWLLYKGETRRQPIAATIDSTNTYEDCPTVLLTGSRTTSADDNHPALESRPCTWPIVSPGEWYRFSCALKATGAYGSGRSPSLQISWYDSSGRYISSKNGSALVVASTFGRYSLVSKAPSSAAYARLFVRAGYNSGRIWVGGATWTNVADDPSHF